MAISNDVLAQESQGIFRGRRNVSFLLEAMIVLAFFIACMSIFVRLLSTSQLRARSASITSEAVMAATNRAEEFCANPKGAEGTVQEGDLIIECEVNATPHKAGTLYNATITVRHKNQQQESYVLNTARYVHADGDAS